MGEEAERLGHRPGGEGVGRIALVEQDDGAFVACILQVQVEERQVARQAKGLVDQGPRRAGDDEEIRPARGLGGAIGGLAGQEKLALEDVLIHAIGPADEELLDPRHRADRLVAERARVDRDGPPDDGLEPATAYRLVQGLTRGVCLIFVQGKEGHGHAELARTEICVAGGGEGFAEEREGNLRQDASTIAGAGVGADASAMGQIDEAGQGALDDLARGPAGDVDDETDAARIALERRVPERRGAVGEAGCCLHDLLSPAGIHVVDPALLRCLPGRPRGRTPPPPGTNSGHPLQRGLRA